MNVRRAVRWAIVGALLAAGAAQAADWPHWRGPNHEGISEEKTFNTDWSTAPKVLWEAPIGSGFSAFAVVKDRAYTCGTKDKKQVLLCLDVATGKPVWEVPFEKSYRDGQGGDGTRATPTVDDGRVYIVGGYGLVLCVNAADGKEIWKKQLGKKPNWGYSGSVLIQGNMAIFPAGGQDGAVLAVDKKTGEPIWKCDDGAPGYSTPYPFTFKGTKYVFCYGAKAGLIANLKTGKLACRIPWETDYDVNASQPNYADGHLFLGTGYNTGSAVYKLEGEGDSLQAVEVWRSKVLMPKFTSCVLIDGVLYAGDQNGTRAVEFKTGKELWSDRGLKNTSILAAGGWLICQSEKGDVMLAKPSREGFKPAGKISPMQGRSWTVPTLANGRLYVRNLEKAVCLDLSK